MLAIWTIITQGPKVLWLKMKNRRMMKRYEKMKAQETKRQPTNRARRRRDARVIAGRRGDRKAVYRALKGREGR